LSQLTNEKLRTFTGTSIFPEKRETNGFRGTLSEQNSYNDTNSSNFKHRNTRKTHTTLDESRRKAFYPTEGSPLKVTIFSLP